MGFSAPASGFSGSTRTRSLQQASEGNSRSPAASSRPHCTCSAAGSAATASDEDTVFSSGTKA